MFNYSNSYPCGYGPYVTGSPSTNPPSTEDYQDYDPPQPQRNQPHPQWDQIQPEWDELQPGWDELTPKCDECPQTPPEWEQPDPRWNQPNRSQPPQQWGQQRIQPQWKYQQNCSWRPKQDYNTMLYRNNQCPFYETMGQPMIYFARAKRNRGQSVNQNPEDQNPANQNPVNSNPVNQKPTNQKPAKRPRNPNCFVRAFRWYTQDHLPVVSDREKMSDLGVAGFASWLDDKYEHYLKEHRLDQSLKDTQTSLVETENEALETIANPCCPCPPNNIKKQTRSQMNSVHMQGGDTSHGTENTVSTEFILPPKDLSRPVSDCMQIVKMKAIDRSLWKTSDKSLALKMIMMKPPISCCSEARMNKKISIKSQSANNVCKNCDTTVIDIDTVKTQEGINNTGVNSMQPKPKLSTPEKKKSEKKEISSVQVSCQCSTKSEAQSNTQTQCEPSNVTWLEAPFSTDCSNSYRIIPSSSQKTSNLTCCGSKVALAGDCSKTTTVKNEPPASDKTSVASKKSTRKNSKESVVICDNITICENNAVCEKFKDKSCQCMSEFIAEMSTQYNYEFCLHCECPTCYQDGVWTCQNNDKGGHIPGPPAVKQTPSTGGAVAPSKTDSCTRPCCPNPEKCAKYPIGAPIEINQQLSKEAPLTAPSKTNSCTHPCCPNPDKCAKRPIGAPIAIATSLKFSKEAPLTPSSKTNSCTRPCRPNPEKCAKRPIGAPIATSQQCSKEAHVVCVNDEIQTSDYAITLEENAVGRCYPLFMKIVCADKLCNDLKCGTVYK